jgi:enoyl reductase-like protein
MHPKLLFADYHIDLASGGHYNAAALRSKVVEIHQNVSAGVGITHNAIDINPSHFNFQFPLWREMRHKALPIEAFCVAARILFTNKAVKITGGISVAGICHRSLKPGSSDGIC